MKVHGSYTSSSFVFAIRGILVFTFLATISCQEDVDLANSEQMLGQWVVQEVVYDGKLQSGWDGVSLTFTKKEPHAGRYDMPATPYDSIWSEVGTWATSGVPSLMILNDSLETNFDVNENELIITMLLPWTAQSTCANGTCLTIVSGEWMFRFSRR